MPKLTLITGGVRSGKSAYAVQLARARASGKKCFLASAQVFDEEMKLRVEQHRRQRGSDFETVEEPLDLGRRFEQESHRVDLILVDCLGMWVNNLLYHYEPHSPKIEKKIGDFLLALTATEVEVILVTSEVGMGVLPENALAREFSDLLGRLNQQVQQLSQELIFMVAGQPFLLKGEGVSL